MLLSLFLLSAVVYSPNRIVTGKEYSFLEYFRTSSGIVVFVVLCIICIGIFVFGFICDEKKHKIHSHVVGIFSVAFLFILLFQYGLASQNIIFSEFSYGRLSLGGGFWLIILGIIMANWGSTNTARGYFFVMISITIGFLVSGHLNSLSILKELFSRSDTFLEQIIRHFWLACSAVAAGIVLGIPIGVYIFRSNKPHKAILFVLNLGQTLPTLALLGLLLIPLGIGFAPAFVVLTIYALFPIVHNTISGLKLVDSEVVTAAKGMGMSPGQVFMKVQFPLAMPVLLGGMRTALSQAIGNTILAGLIGGGGMGSIIFLGLAQSSPDLILLGIIPIVIMTFLLDFAMVYIQQLYQRYYLGVVS